MDSLWKGKNIRLRQCEESDVCLFIDENGDFDTEIMRKYDFIGFPLRAEKIKDQLTSEQKGDNFVWTIETIDTKKPIGQITAFDCDRRNGTFKSGVFIKEDFQGKGYAKEATNLVLNFYFNELRYQKVVAYIYSFNTPSIKFHEKLGFKKEGQIRNMYYSNGKYYDIFYYGMLKNEFTNN